MNKVKMKVNPRIIEHLGSDLITSAAVAVVELIKNSIDAHSKRVNIQFFDGIGQIEKNDKMLVPLDDDMFFLLKGHPLRCIYDGDPFYPQSSIFLPPYFLPLICAVSF